LCTFVVMIGALVGIGEGPTVCLFLVFLAVFLLCVQVSFWESFCCGFHQSHCPVVDLDKSDSGIQVQPDLQLGSNRRAQRDKIPYILSSLTSRHALPGAPSTKSAKYLSSNTDQTKHKQCQVKAPRKNTDKEQTRQHTLRLRNNNNHAKSNRITSDRQRNTLEASKQTRLQQRPEKNT